jgi:CvfB-like winged helix domain
VRSSLSLTSGQRHFDGGVMQQYKPANAMTPATSHRHVSSKGKHPAKKMARLTAKVNDFSDTEPPDFQTGDKIQVEVTSFGPMGASVDIVAYGSHDSDAVLPIDVPALGKGLILQKEIAYFRESRNGFDVERGEILCAYVERVREVEIKGEIERRIDVGLRVFGGRAKATDLSDYILNAIMETDSKSLPIGDKSSPEEIAKYFPGTSKKTFKLALSYLFKEGKVRPGPYKVTLQDGERRVSER